MSLISNLNNQYNNSQLSLLNNKQKDNILFQRLEKLKNKTPDLQNNDFQSLLIQRGNSSSVSSSSFQYQKNHELIMKEIKNDPQKKELYDAALQFESFFTEKMFKAMQKNIPENSLLPKNNGEKIFEEMLMTERVSKIHKTQNLGLADIIYSQLSIQA